MSRRLLRSAFKLLEVLGAIEAWEDCVAHRDAPDPEFVVETSWEYASRLRVQLEHLRQDAGAVEVEDELLEHAAAVVESIEARRGLDDLVLARRCVMQLSSLADEARGLERALLERLTPGKGALTGAHRASRPLGRRRPADDRWGLIFLDIADSTIHQRRAGHAAWQKLQEALFTEIWDAFEGKDRLYYGHERGDLECWATPAEQGGIDLLCTLADHAHAVARAFSSARRSALGGPDQDGGPIRLRVLVGVGVVGVDERGSLTGDLVHRLSVLEGRRFHVRPSATTFTQQAWDEVPAARREGLPVDRLPPARLRGAEQGVVLLRDAGGAARRKLRRIPEVETPVQLVRRDGLSVHASYRLYDESEQGAGLYVSDPPAEGPSEGESVQLAWRDDLGVRVCEARVVWVERGGGLLGLRKETGADVVWISERRGAAEA